MTDDKQHLLVGGLSWRGQINSASDLQDSKSSLLTTQCGENPQSFFISNEPLALRHDKFISVCNSTESCLLLLVKYTASKIKYYRRLFAIDKHVNLSAESLASAIGGITVLISMMSRVIAQITFLIGYGPDSLQVTPFNTSFIPQF